MAPAVLRPLVLVLALAALASCTDSRAVNAAFSQTRVSWFQFDPEADSGLVGLPGFEQAHRVVWQPRDRAVWATDLALAPDGRAALAVNGLGLLLLSDADGTLVTHRPGSQLPLQAFRTSRLFVWDGKLFLGVFQESPSDLPPLTLAWWSPGQLRLAAYPVPSQVADASRQAVQLAPPVAGSVLGLVWKRPAGTGWRFESGTLNLADGSEGTASFAQPTAEPLGEEFAAVRARLADRLGAEVPAMAVRGPGAVLLFSELGWVAVAKPGSGQARLYRLPDLGVAGHYVAALALQRGYLFTWEVTFRGHTGASGVVHVPFGVLAP